MFHCSARQARSARIARGTHPATSSSLGDEGRVPSLLLSTAARDPCFIARSVRVAHLSRRRRASSPAQLMLPRLGAMIGLLHPVGPETTMTYWARRAFVIGATVVLPIALPLIIAGVSSASAAQARSAIPSSAYSVPTSASPTQTVLATPSVVDVLSKTPVTQSPTPTASTQKRKSQHTSSVSCRPKDLQPTLTGRIHLAPQQRTTFQLSLINGSDRTCVARVTRKNFEFKISANNGRMWSTNDCPFAIKTISRKLAADSAVAWPLSWNGRGSRADCRSDRSAPKPGSYVATARLDGAEPVKLRMILKAH